jgi:TolA-binding protein
LKENDKFITSFCGSERPEKVSSQVSFRQVVKLNQE